MDINDKIEKLRDRLNKSVREDDNYAVVYDLSTKLDILINIYYNKEYPKRNKKVVCR